MPEPSPPSAEWWRDGVVHQVYVRSFADSDGDGIGDLQGVRDRLPYLRDLGVDAIWLNPCYPSPQRDHGYDVADYFAIEPAYGSMEAFDALLVDAHALGMRVLMDLVANHCSDQHAWFQQALKAGPGSEERARFHFRDGRGPDGGEPPNNWRSVFGGPAWDRVTEADGRPGQWYLHAFDATQPDFDWSNPEVADLFDDVLRFWFDRGVDGFRIDVAHGMAKEPGLADWPLPIHRSSDYNQHLFHRPEVHDIHRRWRRLADAYGPERALTLVGEVWVSDITQLADYLRSDELQQAFAFDLVTGPWGAVSWRESIDATVREITGVAPGEAPGERATGASVTWTLSNHDVHRTVTRLGQDQHPRLGPDEDPAREKLLERIRYRGPVDLELGTARARAAILLLLALPGAVYLYQGEELGLPEWLELPDEARQDPTWERSGHVEHGRDGCRVPLPWERDGASYGFSPAGTTAPPWLPQPDWWGDLAADLQVGDRASTLELYRAALQLRREVFDQPVTGPGGGLAFDDELRRADVLVVRRGRARAVVAFDDQPVELPGGWGEIVLASAPLVGRRLPGSAAAWVRER